MIVGGYDLHLYCKECSTFGQAVNNPPTYTKAMSEMKERGWKYIKAEDDVLCPECAKK